MYHRQLSEQAIISGFRKGDADIIREYFYGYCEAGYHYYDQKYQLSSKENFDMDLDMPEVMDERAILSHEATMGEASMPAPTMAEPMAFEDMDFIREEVMDQKRTTPKFITELQPGEIFVFGSNLKGMHGGGAAYIAYRKFGAIMGQGVGLQGQSYAIPTMQGGVETIRPYVDEFIGFAKEHQELTFLVTRIGCGIAGFTDEEIAPLFEQAHDVENIVLPPNW